MNILITYLMAFMFIFVGETKPVVFSYYQAVPEQTDADPSMSACGKTMGAWEQIAIHRNYRHNGEHDCGDVILAYNPRVGFKLIVINDITAIHTPSERWDVLVGNEEPAMEYGLDDGWVINVSRLDVIPFEW